MTVYGLSIPIWLTLAMPDDVQSEIALAAMIGRTEAQRRDWLRYRLSELRRTQWDRKPGNPAKRPASLRPSKAVASTGYRSDSAAHKEARQKVNPEKRRAIARKGQSAWQISRAQNSSAR